MKKLTLIAVLFFLSFNIFSQMDTTKNKSTNPLKPNNGSGINQHSTYNDSLNNRNQGIRSNSKNTNTPNNSGSKGNSKTKKQNNLYMPADSTNKK